ncbi:MAG: hypothetical protein QME96_04455 [Myxococcota bacterium]|nr:hypothetical protein [Myxococcota bacterium]
MTTALSFRVEWEAAAGVTDAVLARTWARLEIAVGSTCVTRVLDRVCNGERTGVYTSVFPLAEWIVENWWSLLHQPRPAPGPLSARRMPARSPGLRSWVQRHGMLRARAGGALPDLVFARDGDEVLTEWSADDPDEQPSRPVQFLGRGHAILPVSDVQSALAGLVDQVLARLAGLSEPDAVRLSENWTEIGRSSRDERDLCARAARVGLDPYDADQMTDDVIRLLERDAGLLDDSVRDDLLDACGTADLTPALSAVRRAEDELRRFIGRPVDVRALASKLTPRASGIAPYRVGYHLAGEVRAKILGCCAGAPVLDLPGLFERTLGWPVGEQVSDLELGSERVRALSGLSAAGTPHVVRPPDGKRPAAERFLLARALYGVLESGGAGRMRLLTEASTRVQAIGRSFAAELLAPADGLRARVGDEGIVSDDRVEALAEEYRVSAMVIQHQLANHGIGTWSAAGW